MEVSKELRSDIDCNQMQLKTAIRNHQILVLKLRNDPASTEIQMKIDNAQEEIICIGLEQKNLIERLRREFKAYQKNCKSNAVANKGIEERRFNFNNTLTRARKQNVLPRSGSVTSVSDDSVDVLSRHSSPEPAVSPYELPQAEFLVKMGLCTHEVFRELQNKRVERKRRSTAHPHFLYGTNRWDYSSKRKRNAYLLTNVSPPNTRQSVKNKMRGDHRGPSPPHKSYSRPDSPSHKKNIPSGLNIPNLPSGLTIERINSNRSSPDTKLCIVCRSSGNLSVCENCQNGFHVSCHNRPLVQPPRQCPRCLAGGKRDLSIIAGGITVSCIPQEVKDKIEEKKELLQRNKNLNAEFTLLQDKHSQLKDSLLNQKVTNEDLKNLQDATEVNIKRIVTFITEMKSSASPPPSPQSPKKEAEEVAS